MKKLCCILIMSLVAPIVCMENDRVVNFKCNPGFIAVKESNLQLMKTLNAHYQQHKKKADIEGVVPFFANVSAYAVSLVNNALNVAPDKFGEYYNNTLSAPDRILLIKASGQYGDDGKTLMLNVPELTKKLIEVCFFNYNMHTRIKKYNNAVSGSEQKIFETYQRNDNLRTTIKNYFKDDDEDYVRNYFKEQLIYNKSLFGAWAPKSSIADSPSTMNLLTNNIYPGSLFLNGYHSNNQYGCTIPLRISDTIHQTYGSCFIINTRECRVTDVRGKQCVLWVLNHNDPSAHRATRIKHKSDIKGCVFSKTEDGVGYAVTYSEHDMVFSTITTGKDGQSVIESVHVDTPNKGTIVDVCFKHNNNQFLVATYEGLNSVLRCWAMNGKRGAEALYPFKEYAFVEKIFVSGDTLVLLFVVAHQCALYKCKLLDNENYEFVFSSELQCKYPLCYEYFFNFINGVTFIPRGDSTFMYDLSDSPYFHVRAAVSEEKSKQSSGFFGDLMNIFTSQPVTSECCRVYSPDGQFLLSNSLKNRLGVRWVETAVLDAVTHKQIFSIDTLHKNFAGVGFTHDGTELIFLNHQSQHETVSLLNDDDKNCLQAIEDVAFQNVGVTSLLKRLCMECKENGGATVQTHSPTHKMLLDWKSQSSVLRTLLTTCLPLYKKSVGGNKK